IADDADAVLEAQRQDRLEHALEQGLVAGVRILEAGELRQRERALAERLEHDRGRPALRDEAAHHGQRRIEPVSREAGPAAHPDRLVLRHESPPRPLVLPTKTAACPGLWQTDLSDGFRDCVYASRAPPAPDL